MNESLFRRLLGSAEGTTLDFKAEPYPFDRSDRLEKSRLLRDLIAFANAERRETAYILTGVKEENGRVVDTPGVSSDSHPDDAQLQQFVNEKLNRTLRFSYRPFTFDGKEFGVLEIPRQERPFFTTGTCGGVRKETVYVRSGSSTAVADPARVYEMGRSDTRHVERFFKQEVDRLNQVFEREREGVPVGDVLRGLCVSDSKTRALASYYVFANRVTEAVPLLISNLDVNDDDLTLMTVQAMGRLRVVEAADRLMALAAEGRPRISGTAMTALTTIGAHAVTRKNLGVWINWLTSNEELLWQGAATLLKLNVLEDRLDVSSMASRLLPLVDLPPGRRRESVLALLFHARGVAGRLDPPHIIADPDRSEVERLWAYRIAAVDGGDPAFAARALLARLDDGAGEEDYFELRNLALIGRDSGDPESLEAFASFCSWAAGAALGEPEDLLRRYPTPQPSRPGPQALAMGRILRELSGLEQDPELEDFLERVPAAARLLRDRPSIPLILLGPVSPYTCPAVRQFLAEKHGYHVIDHRGADSAAIKRSVKELRRHARVLLILPREIPLELCHLLVHLYDRGKVNITAASPAEGEFELPESSVLLALMSRQDHDDLELVTGWARNKFDRVVGPVIEI